MINPDKTNKRKTKDEENDEHKIKKCFEYIRDLKIAKREKSLRRKARLVAVMIVVKQRGALQEEQLTKTNNEAKWLERFGARRLKSGDAQLHRGIKRLVLKFSST
nr:hypothetical protein [Tanacetum cinerariifolium]